MTKKKPMTKKPILERIEASKNHLLNEIEEACKIGRSVFMQGSMWGKQEPTKTKKEANGKNEFNLFNIETWEKF